MVARVAILKLGSTYPRLARRMGDYEDWVASGLRLPVGWVRVVRIREGEEPPDPRRVGAAVLTGAHEMVTERAWWSEKAAVWVRDAVAAGVPVLGICYGHQLLADALGGEVGCTPGGHEAGSITVRRDPGSHEDPLFGHLPDAFSAYAIHSQSVTRLPAGSVRLASSDREPNQAFRVGACAWGVQFHPEFPEGAIRYYLLRERPGLERAGYDPDRLLERLVPSEAASVLADFAGLVGQRLADEGERQ